MKQRTRISKEALAKYDALVVETPVPGISNDELASLVTPEQVAEAKVRVKSRAQSRIVTMRRKSNTLALTDLVVSE